MQYLTQKKQTLMKKRKCFSLAIISVLFVYSCESLGKENPKTLGNSNFDLEKMSFNEDPSTLFGKNKYYKTTIKNDNGSDIAYNYIISKKENPGVKVSLGNIDISKYKYNFKISKDNKIIGVTISFITKENLKEIIIKDLETQFNRYRATINQVYDTPSIYRWQTPDKIIHFVYSEFEGDHIYNISIVNRKFDCNTFPLESTFVGEDICLKKYTKK